MENNTMDNLLTPVNAAKAMGLVLLVHGLFHVLAPVPTAKKYGVPSNEDGQYNMPIRRIGCALLFTFVVAWCLIFQEDGDRYKAYAFGTLIFFLEHLQSVLNRECSSTFDSVIALENAFFIYAFLYNKDWAPVAAKVGCSIFLGFGISLIVAPKFIHVNVWKSSPKFIEHEKHGPYIIMTMRAIGFCMLQTGIFTSLIEYSGEEMMMDPIVAFGSSCFVLVLGLLFNMTLSNLGLSLRHLAMASAGAALSFLMIVGAKEEDGMVENKEAE